MQFEMSILQKIILTLTIDILVSVKLCRSLLIELN
jgi:hypothetical protein